MQAKTADFDAMEAKMAEFSAMQAKMTEFAAMKEKIEALERDNKNLFGKVGGATFNANSRRFVLVRGRESSFPLFLNDLYQHMVAVYFLFPAWPKTPARRDWHLKLYSQPHCFAFRR